MDSFDLSQICFGPMSHFHASCRRKKDIMPRHGCYQEKNKNLGAARRMEMDFKEFYENKSQSRESIAHQK